MFDCVEYQRAVTNARRIATRIKKLSLDYAERSQTVPSAYLLKIRPDEKWSSSEASAYIEGTITQKNKDGEFIFSGVIQEIDPECGEILVLKDNGTGQPLPEFPIFLAPVDYYKALEEFSKEILLEGVSLFEAMPENIRQGKPSDKVLALDKGLRVAQKEALNNALTRDLSFVWGPPGTGKSYTLGRIVANLYAQKKRVLLLSTTNVAVDVATFAVDDACADLGMPLEKKELIRLVGNLSDIEEFRRRPHLCSYSDLLRQYDLQEQDLGKTIADLRQKRHRLPKTSKTFFELYAQEKAIQQDIKELGEMRRLAIGKLISSAKILAITFTSAIFRQILQTEYFDAIIVDEASQIPLAAWIYLTYNHSNRGTPKIVVAGDPLQLQPIPPQNLRSAILSKDDKEAVFKWVGTSIYSHVGLSSPNCDFPAVAFLDQQSRMHREICEAVSRTYYENRLHGEATSLLDKKLSPLVILQCESQKTSKDHRNECCATTIEDYVSALVEKYKDKGTNVKIRILTAYKNQRILIASRLCSKTYPENIRVEVSTVHSSQGSEADIVIFDVSDDPDSWFVAESENDGAKHMWCVAVSRAKNQCALTLSNPDLSILQKNRHAPSLFKNSTLIPIK